MVLSNHLSNTGDMHALDHVFAETLAKHRRPQAARLPTRREVDGMLEEILGLLFP